MLPLAVEMLRHRRPWRTAPWWSTFRAAQPSPRRYLAVTEVYGQPASRTACYIKRVAAAKSIAAALTAVGVLCVEFFVLQDGSLRGQRIAPPPHNSGHYSQNALDVSQFEPQVRTMTACRSVQPRQHSPPSC